MTDQNSQFFAILTAAGKAKQANADALGVPWTFAQMGVGDANNTEPMPSEQQTQLINERRRAPLNQLKVDPNNPNIIIAEQVIPESVGGWWIREIGLYDTAGDLVAVANCAPSFKPLLSQGSGRTQVVRMNLIVSNTANVELKIDPSIVLATRSYVDAKVLEEIYKLDSKQSVRVATTTNIALVGLQTIDGVVLVAGDRVLVKNQTVLQDNGLYTVTAGAWARTPDTDTSTKVTPGLLVAVEQGAACADTLWLLATDGPIVLGTTPLAFKSVTQGLAPINSPAFTGVPMAPTAPRFDNSKTLVNAEFVNEAVGGFRRTIYPLEQDQVISPEMVNSFIYAVSAITRAKLPLLSSVPWGSTLTFGAISSSSLTVQCQGTDTIWGTASSAGLASMKVNMSDTLQLVAAPFGWICTGGSSMLAYQRNTGVFASSLDAAGYQKLPSGFIEQWGIASNLGTSEIRTITLPIAFPVGAKAPISTGDGANPLVRIAALGQNTIQIQNMGTAGQNAYWQVIGY